MSNIIWIVVIMVLVVAIKYIVETYFKESKSAPDLSVYERKPYLFDAASEFNLFKVLVGLFGDKYYIFPQVNYSHLIQPKKTTWADEKKHRSRIDRKSADFVLCDKDRVVPQLIIELDGSVHNFKSKQARDEFINAITNIVNLPLLHIKTESMDKEYIRATITEKLNQSKT